MKPLLERLMGALASKDESEAHKQLASEWLNAGLPPELREEYTDIITYTSGEKCTPAEARIVFQTRMRKDGVKKPQVASIEAIQAAIRDFGQPRREPLDADVFGTEEGE